MSWCPADSVPPVMKLYEGSVVSRDGREEDLRSLLKLLLQKHCQDRGSCNIEKGGG